MNKSIPDPGLCRRALLAVAIIPWFFTLGGCGDDDSSSDSSDTRTGTFVDSPVAGLDYAGEQTLQP